MSKLSVWIKALVAFAFSLVGITAFATPGSDYNLVPGVTPISKQLYELHMTIFWICVVIGVIVFAVMFWSLWHHRKSKGHKPATFTHSNKLEFWWSLIPFLILVGMSIPATIVMINMENDAQADINIQVTGYQWKWHYEYLDQGLSFYSNLSTPQAQIEGKAKKGKWYLLEVDRPLVVPIHKKIRFLVTSADVIHAWWVPELGVKRDAIPGFIHESWAYIEKPGIYRGQCAELCGIHHGFMPIVVVAKTQKNFDKWVMQERKREGKSVNGVVPSNKPKPAMTREALMALGKKTYTNTCSVCHKSGGQGMPPAFPAIKGSPIATGPVAAHINLVLNGKPGTAMQAFRDQLSDKQIASVITYQRNSWGNNNKSKYGKNAGGLVQPAQIQKAKAAG